jgi:murein DD-endopeptidase MepM/ murein hydrolase activator NlpD
MSRPLLPVPIRVVVVALLAAFALTAAPARADVGKASTGGAAYAEPDVTDVRCSTTGSATCSPGVRLRVGGEHLEATRTVVFLGRRGRADDARVRPLKAGPHRVLVTVPPAAVSGRVRVLAGGERATGPRVRVAAVPPSAKAAPDAAPQTLVAADPAAGVFPVRDSHEYGSATNRFGGGRGHEGQDVFAACGTRLVAALSGTVKLARWHDRAGNYVVIEAADGTAQAYMHLQQPAGVAKGDLVQAGEPIGRVGDTGRASGCHLHFELWTAPGWYEGGSPIDPLPLLERLDAAT